MATIYNSFVDHQEIGEQLIEVVRQLGEPITFIVAEGEESITGLACFDDAVSTSNLSTERNLKISGEMAFENNLQLVTLQGSYFTRDLFPDKKYLLLSTEGNPYTDKLANVEVYECNKTVDIGYVVKQENEAGVFVEQKIKTYNDIPSFFNTTLAQPQQTDVGLLSRTLTTITVPCDYLLAVGNKIFVNEFVKQGVENPVTILTEQTYNVEAVDLSLMQTYDEVTFFGIITAEIKKDI